MTGFVWGFGEARVAEVDQDRVLRAAIEHTLLAPQTTPLAVVALCREAMAQRFGGVCVHPVHVARARAELHAQSVRLVTVVGFPSGASHSRCKAFETELAVADGADELDMVMQIGSAKAGDWPSVEADVQAVVQAARGRPVKLILETGLLNDEEKLLGCEVALRCEVAFVKTCTGFAEGAATSADVALLALALGGRVGIKASGGIRSLAQARALLAAGASRLGTSAGIRIVSELEAELA